MPRDKSRFWNRMARGYAQRPVADLPAYEHKLERTAELMRPDMRVLEFGCGTGSTSLAHAPRVARIDAVDFSSEMIAIANERKEEQGVKNVEFHVSSLEDWPCPHPEGPYDMVMAHSVLHLVQDVDVALSLIREQLSLGGVFISSTVCLSEMNGLVKRFLPLGAWLGIIPRITAFTAEGLCRKIAASGFETELVWRPKPDAAVFIIARAN